MTQIARASIGDIMKSFRLWDYRLKPGIENYLLAAFDWANGDPMMLQMAAQRDERKRIAQELHDTLLQGFTGIAVKLDALTTNLPPSLFDVKEQLQQTLELMYSCLGETRGSIWNLRSPTLVNSGDLPEALHVASKRVLARTSITLDFSVQGSMRKIGEIIEHQLLRVCEEPLANVVKHAHATKVEVVLHFTLQEVQLQVRDNGRGFEARSWGDSKGNHFGLLGIRERIASLCGVLSVDSLPGKGTRLLATIPVQRTLRVNARKTRELRSATDTVLISA